MEDEYKYTAPLDDTVAYESPIAESRLLNPDTNTEVVDVCEYVQHSGDQTDDYCEKEVVLDSDDEGGVQNEVENLVNGESFCLVGRSFGRDTTGLRKRQQVPAGYFRRLDSKVNAHRFLHLDSARSAMCDKESNAGRTCFDNDQDHLVLMDCVVSRSTDHKPIPADAKELHQEYLNKVRESLTKGSLFERKLSRKCKAMDMEKDSNYDYEHAKLNYLESPEPAETQGKALDFVDHYLSITDLGSPKDVETRKTDRIKSPPSLRSGSQSLARRVNLGRTASKSMTFDWAEEPIEKAEFTSLRKTKDSNFRFEGNRSGYLSVDLDSDNVNMQKEKVSSLQSIEKLPEKLSPNNLDRNSMDSHDIDKVGSNSENCIANDSMELDEQFDAGLLRQNVEKGEQLRVTSDALDIGLDTQMAAEAMEALIDAPPPMFDACFTHHGSGNIFVDSSYGVTKKCEHIVDPEEAFVGWRKKEKRSKGVKISTVQLTKNKSCSAAKQFKNKRGAVAQFLVKENLMTEKLLTEKELNCRNPGYTNNSKRRGPPRITVQQDEDGFTGRDILKEFQKDHCLSEYIGCNPDGRKSKETTDTIKSEAPPKRRKMINLYDDVSKTGVSGNCLKLNSESSAKRKEHFNLDVADRSLSKLNMWIHPKGKRARQRVPLHSNRSSKQCSPCVAIYENNNAKKRPVVNEEAHKRVAGLLVYARRRQFSSERKHSGSSMKLTDDLCSPSVNDSEFSDRQVQISTEFDRAKPLEQCGKLDDGHFPPSVDTSGKKSDVLSNGNSKTLQVFEDSDNTKKPCNHLSRSPLMKELMRLGYRESLPDFLPKDSRRRRAMEKFCILFSLNLGISILKQQRKIVSRLGLSVASCCSDATHFVTDRFVRTRNTLEAIALGKPVVTHLWLESCEQAGYVIDEKSYILRDEKKEKEYGFSMPVSLTRASQHPLLKGHRVFITPNVKPGIDVINCLVKAVHGQAIQNMLRAKTKDKVIPDDLLILSCEEDYTICVPFLEKGALVYDSELLLNGIVTQKLEYKRYQLFKDFSNNGPSGARKRMKIWPV